MKKIAIQGIRGAFHEAAARAYFHAEEIRIEPYLQFEDLVRSVGDGEIKYGIIAVENSLTGRIQSNEVLLKRYPVKSLGEYRLQINQCLGALKDIDFSQLREIHSHKVALGQCRNFFNENRHLIPVEDIDTALSARELARYKIPTRGAIASKEALKHYGLQVLAENIQDSRDNYTRFLIITQDKKKIKYGQDTEQK